MNRTPRHALVTGGGTGVGAAVAHRFARDGFNVTITGRRESALQQVAIGNDSILALTADVTAPEELDSAVASASDRFGPVSVVVANAGIADSKPFDKLTRDDMQHLFDVNVLGVFNTFQAVLPQMRKAGWGRLVAMASIAGLKGYGYITHYCASKHAVVGMVRALSAELATTGVTTNAVCPAYVDTEMTQRTIANIVEKTGMSAVEAEKRLVAMNPQGRLITVEEVADTVSWLCGEDAGSVNGLAIPVAGGET